MEKKNRIDAIRIELEEPCIMGLVDPEDRDELRNRIIEKIRPDVAALFVTETERILTECCNLSPEDPTKGQDFSKPDLTG